MQPLTPSDPRVAGEFRLSARLGLGGMGRVFLGYSPGGRAVAVKICHPDLAADSAFVRRFAREVIAAQAVNGLFTAPVVAAGPYDNPPWLATVYVPGPSLQDYVKGFGPLPEPAVWRLAAGLAEALQAVHATGLVHRDLKPTNVLLAGDGPRVIDFGIASALEVTGLTSAGSILGSPPYMSPEQALGTQAWTASDVFALGSTLAFAATGEPPFGSGDAPAVLFRVVHTAPALDPLPGRLRDLVAACLAKDPADRPTLPQLLAACQATAGWGGSAASFWPSQVAAVIAGYQADPASAAPSPETVPPGARGAASTVRTSFGRAGTAAAGVFGRRRLLAGLGGLAAAGGLAAGWELTHSGRGGSPTVVRNRAAWVHRTGGQVRSSPAISGGTLYIGSDDGVVYALDAATGRPTGTFRTGGPVSGGVTVAGGTLFAGSADGKVHAFTVGDTGASWTYRTGGAVATAPMSAGGGVVYAGSSDHYIYALNVGTGQRIWRTPAGGPVTSGPVEAGQPLADGVVWAGSEDGHMYALNADTGHVVWRYPAGGVIHSGLVTDASNAYFGTDSGSLYSLSFDPFFDNSQQVRWQFQAGGAIQGTPVYADDIMFAGSASSEVYAVGLTTGQQLWKYRTEGPVRSGPAVGGGILYVGSDDGYLYAIDSLAGSLRWRYKTGGPIRSRILAAGGLVYFGSLDQRVYALRA